MDFISSDNKALSSLSSMYDEATAAIQSINDGTLSEEILDSYIPTLENVIVAVDKEKIFSKNEEFEDISTKSLKYLFLQYYLGKTHLRANGIDAKIRNHHLIEAKKSFQSFISLCKSLCIIKFDDDENENIDKEVSDIHSILFCIINFFYIYIILG
jgi:hypothetical protein